MTFFLDWRQSGGRWVGDGWMVISVSNDKCHGISKVWSAGPAAAAPAWARAMARRRECTRE